MNLTAEGWKLSQHTNQAPGQWQMGCHPATHPQQLGLRTQGMPPYSPIRIRSGRGARRLSLNSNASVHTGPSNETPTRSFPVSNRGKGRRHVAAALSSKTNAGNDEVAMLSKFENQEAPASDAAAEQQQVEAKLPRSVLKRKLPLSFTTPEGSHAGD
jgi:hypothetical protein